MKTEQLYDLFKKSTGISTDSRSVREGQMFFSLWGGNYNGNKFAADAINRGACCAVIDDPAFESGKTILVDDCLFELHALAAHYRKELKVPVMAITGTNGKTTTKELIAAILSKKYKVHFTKENLNNHIGVPLTILSAPADTEMMIIEMGANHSGEIRSLCLIAKPDYGIITNIGKAHIEGFGSVEGVVKAKMELYEFLKRSNGMALYNDNNQILTEKIFKSAVRAVPYSAPDGTPLEIEAVQSGLMLGITVSHFNRSWKINTSLFGIHNLENIKASIAAGLFFGVKMDEIADAIENYVPANNRSQVRVTRYNTIICDSYNANPESMARSIESFAGTGGDSRRLIILGDMFELGDQAETEHLKILEKLKKIQVENVLLAGPLFNKLAAGYGYLSFDNVNTLIGHLKKDQLKGFQILVKGSRGMMLEKIYDYL
jgi:UDP-N-acetylmuramoyl-tripeptide--D-alanyl-D-alanine ligase